MKVHIKKAKKTYLPGIFPPQKSIRMFTTSIISMIRSLPISLAALNRECSRLMCRKKKQKYNEKIKHILKVMPVSLPVILDCCTHIYLLHGCVFSAALCAANHKVVPYWLYAHYFLSNIFLLLKKKNSGKSVIVILL